MNALLQCEGSHVSLIYDDKAERRPLDAGPLIDLGRRYAVAREHKDPDAIKALGRALYDWLDGREQWLKTLNPRANPPFILEIRANDPIGPDWAVLHAPWELLADEAGHFAADAELRYAPARRLGIPEKSPPPLDEYRLGVAFMAAAPHGGVELDFEAEEAAIMSAARRDLDLFVEESGDPDELGRRLAALKQPPPVLHLSCHGHNAWPASGNQPILMMETGTGAPRPVTAGALFEALGDYRPRLLFLSACLTAAADHSKTESETLSGAMAGRMVRDLPAVLGWDGSVKDIAATAFARELYDDLGRGMALPQAAGFARRALLNATFPQAGPGKEADPGLSARIGAEAELVRNDWHLARVWLGREGGGPVAVAGGFERSLIPPDAGVKIILAVKATERLEVADPAMFVGRRRELRKSLQVLSGRETAGLLLHGMGRLGKSSLAGRIIDRLPEFAPAVVFGDYSVLGVADALAAALEAHEPAAKLIAERRKFLHDDPAALRDLLVQLLDGPCKTAKAGKPVLLLIDDVERILEPDPNGGRHRVRAEFLPVMSALLRAFTPQRSNSRLLLTGRFPFSLVEGGRDLAKNLAELELSEFTQTARRKLALRQIKAAQSPTEGEALSDAELNDRLPLLERAEAIARGNPGLQDFLGADFVLRPAVPVAVAKTTLDDMERYLNGGELPRTEEARAFVQNLAIENLLELAGPSNLSLLRAMTLFPVPVPESVVAAFRTIGGEAKRLRDLGLLVPANDIVSPGVIALAANSLAAARLDPLSEQDRGDLARLATPALFAAWGGAAGRLNRSFAADIALSGIALLARDVDVLDSCGRDAVAGLASQGQPKQAGDLGERIVAAFEAAGRAPPLDLLAKTAEALQTAGDGAAAEVILAKGGAGLGETDDPTELQQLSDFAFAQGKRQSAAGDLDGALATFERFAQLGKKRGHEQQFAVARGAVADILQARGDLDAALRIREEEELPVYIRLGDVRSAAVTRGQIADILQARGDLDAALRIRQEEELPIYIRLGDVRAAAVTRGKIADILQSRGDLDAALRIREEEELPVYIRLGDVRSAAVTRGQIADILQARGDLDAALRIRQEEELPIYIRLGDVRAAAVTRGKIADILQSRGDLDAALRIRQEEELPIYIRLGDVRAAAVTRGKIADILQSRGDLDAALRIREEEELPVYIRLGDVRSAAVTRGKIADILQARGELDAALRIRQEEQLPVYIRLGDVREAAVTRGKIADILEARGDLDAALRIRQEEQLPVYIRLGDVRSAAVTRGKIADILQARGDLDAALRIREEEVIPVFTRLGDVRSAAVTRGKIADILQARGEPDAALALQEEVLAAHNKLGDVDGIAATLWAIAQIEMQREQYAAAAPRIAEAWAIVEKIGRAEGIAIIGATHGQFLAARGEMNDARAVLAKSAAAYRKLGRAAKAEQVERIMRDIEQPKPD